MKEKTDKLITWLSIGIALLASIFAIVFALDTVSNNGMFNIAYWITFLCVVLCIVGILGFALWAFVKKFSDDRKGAIRTIIVIAIAVVVVIVSYFLASGSDVPFALLDKNNLTVGACKWIGAACIMVYILVIGAALSIVYVECAKFFKKK